MRPMEISRREVDILPVLVPEEKDLLPFIDKFGDLVRRTIMDNWEKTNEELVDLIREKTK